MASLGGSQESGGHGRQEAAAGGHSRALPLPQASLRRRKLDSGDSQSWSLTANGLGSLEESVGLPGTWGPTCAPSGRALGFKLPNSHSPQRRPQPRQDLASGYADTGHHGSLMPPTRPASGGAANPQPSQRHPASKEQPDSATTSDAKNLPACPCMGF